MNKNYKEHACDLMPATGVYLTFTPREDSTWILTIQREATEEDLEENHYLEDVGDTLWTTELAIRCCPFCGEVLPGVESGKKTTFGEFRHIDSSGWSSKVM